MPKAKKHRRKASITSSSLTGVPLPSGSSSNPSSTRTFIRQFHVLIKRKAQLQRLLEEPRIRKFDEQDATRKELASIEREITNLGGLETYQRMSSIGQGNDRGGGSEKVLIGWLNEFSEPQRLCETNGRFKLLEVGALKHDNYAAHASWIDNTPIDLHSRHPSIKEQDFLLLSEDQNRSKWDIISLSLVVNFVPEPKHRGRMLQLAHTMLRSDGYLFLAVCITHPVVPSLLSDHIMSSCPFLVYSIPGT
ncbi:unnamed protein product [Somion occarium]|uniref:25S rRNA adenine-N(1) methyltransferase n=1 Tax=Somion occarium TaxID=3059160 RepID=A0ABP1DAP6_9APHY